MAPERQSARAEKRATTANPGPFQDMGRPVRLHATLIPDATEPLLAPPALRLRVVPPDAGMSAELRALQKVDLALIGQGDSWTVPAGPRVRATLHASFGSRLRYNIPALLPLVRALQLAGRGRHTRRAYLTYNRALLIDSAKLPEAIGTNDIQAFLLRAADRAPASRNLMLSAFRFFYDTVLKRSLTTDLETVRRKRPLPAVLSRAEVNAILGALPNRKHQALLALVYSAGLRVSEVVRLRQADIEPERQVIHIRDAKGSKDRYGILARTARRTLAIYTADRAFAARLAVSPYVFPGQKIDRHVTVRTAQRIFKRACARAGIQKAVSIHDLRHAFATHLLESGTNIKMIQKLLGHQSLRATEIYTHVANTEILQVQSPLDLPPPSLPTNS